MEEDERISVRIGEKSPSELEDEKARDLSTIELLELVHERTLCQSHCEEQREAGKNSDSHIHSNKDSSMNELDISYSDFILWVKENYGDELVDNMDDCDLENMQSVMRERNRYEKIDMMTFAIHQLADHGYDHLLQEAEQRIDGKLLGALRTYLKEKMEDSKHRTEIKVADLVEVTSPEVRMGDKGDDEEEESVLMYM